MKNTQLSEKVRRVIQRLNEDRLIFKTVKCPGDLRK